MDPKNNIYRGPMLKTSLRYLLILFVIHKIPLHADGYERNPSVSEEVWNDLAPYFLPESHPMKKELDSIFSKRKILRSTDKMRQAGFLLLAESGKDLNVARHYRLRGYVLKMFLDGNDVDEGANWKRRIEGAKILQASIDSHGFQDCMKLPKKWIYPLPPKYFSKNGRVRRKFVLIAEDMYTLDDHKNYKRYRTKMTEELLYKLYVIVTENRLYDSLYPHNVPFCDDGKLAFVDTEFVNYQKHEVPLFVLTQYLSGEPRNFWHNLAEEYKKHPH